jgi:ubiquinone/menaquinone biosynthesis C-methylase UbiE
MSDNDGVVRHETNEAQAGFWQAAGPVWEQRQEQLDAQITEHGLKAIDVLAPQPGETIVDIGSGTGTSSFQLAERVGDSGRVIGCDISSTMCNAARARAAKLGITNVEFVAADAHAYRFERSADAVFSRFGVMFFGDPKGAFANIRTALRPGGRLGFVCWQAPAVNPWITKPLEAARKHVEIPFGTDPRAPSPFAFADPEWVREVLAAAGFADVALEPYEATVHLGPDIDSAVQFLMGINPATAGIAERDPDLATRLFADVADALRPHLTDAGVVTDSATWVVTAASPD